MALQSTGSVLNSEGTGLPSLSPWFSRRGVSCFVSKLIFSQDFGKVSVLLLRIRGVGHARSCLLSFRLVCVGCDSCFTNSLSWCVTPAGWEFSTAGVSPLATVHFSTDSLCSESLVCWWGKKSQLKIRNLSNQIPSLHIPESVIYLKMSAFNTICNLLENQCG